MISLLSALSLTMEIYVCIAIFAVLIIAEAVALGMLVKWKKSATDKKQKEVKKEDEKNAFAFAPLFMTLSVALTTATLKLVLYAMIGVSVVLALVVFITAIAFSQKMKRDQDQKQEEAPAQEAQPVEEPVEDEVEEVAEEEIVADEEPAEEVVEEVAEEETVAEEEAVEEELVADEEPVEEEEPAREETVFVVEQPIPMFVKPKLAPEKETKVREREVVIDNVTYMMKDDRYLFNPAENDWYIMLTKTFTAKLIQSEDYVKYYYSILKNELLSYKKVHARMSKKRESFNFGRTCLARLSIRGKTLRLHLALDANEYAETKYIVEDMSATKSLADTPLMYRIKNDRRVKYAKDLIATLMEKVGAVKQEVEPVDYVAMYPYEETEPLIERDLITRKWYKGRVPDSGFDFAQKTFMARLIQSNDAVKEYYSKVKNHLLSYKKVHDRMSKKRETFRFGRACVARMAIRGKTLRLYLALNPADYVDTKYIFEDFSEVKSVADTPFAIKLKNPRRLKYAIELIDDTMVNMGVVQKRDIVHTDYTSDLAYESTEDLMEKGLITNVHVKGNSFVAQHFTFKAKDVEEEVAADEDAE